MTDWGLEREHRPRRYFGGKRKHLGSRLRYFVASLYFSTAMKLFLMKSFRYFTIVSSQRIQILPMKTINGLSWIL